MTDSDDADVYVLRNVSEHALQLRLDGRLLGTPEPDEVVKVPGDLYESHEFAETLWAVVTSPPAAVVRRRQKKAAEAAEAAEAAVTDGGAEDSATDSSTTGEE